MIEPIDTHDFPHRDRADLLNVIEKAAIALAERAGGAAAAPAVAILTSPADPPKAAPADLSAKLADGSLRYVKRKEAAAMLRCSVDKVKGLIEEYDAGIRVGSTWYLDRTKLPFPR